MTIHLKQRGVLLVNQGSPNSWSDTDVKTYLKTLLMDPHVLDLPSIFRKFVVNLFLIPVRSKKSAKSYQEIWWQQGPPLLVLSKKVKGLLQERSGLPVSLGMLYGKPTIQDAINELRPQGIKEILLIPMYPHYSKATFGSVIDKTKAIINKMNKGIDLKIVPPYYDHPAYLGALVTSAERYLNWDYDHILFSYHGIPVKHIKNTDPTGNHCLEVKKCCLTPSPAHKTCYRHQALFTTSAIAKMLKIPRDKYSVAFKNKFSSNGWLQPLTMEEIPRLARENVKKLLVICPSFVADCRETLQEIGIRGKTIFLENGGEELRMVRCLNENPAWINALNEFCTKTTTFFSKD